MKVQFAAPAPVLFACPERAFTLENDGRGERIRTSGPCLPKALPLVAPVDLQRVCLSGFCSLMAGVLFWFTGKGSSRTSAPVQMEAGVTSSHEALWAEVVATYEPEPFVYFVGAPNGLVKIGFAKDFDARLSQLVCMSPVPLQVLAWTRGGRKEEGDYHQRFKAYRHHGEWFELTPEIQAEIDRLLAVINGGPNDPD